MKSIHAAHRGDNVGTPKVSTQSNLRTVAVAHPSLRRLKTIYAIASQFPCFPGGGAQRYLDLECFHKNGADHLYVVGTTTDSGSPKIIYGHAKMYGCGTSASIGLC